jgi:imidazolonepropionase-like amidohydrolase
VWLESGRIEDVAVPLEWSTVVPAGRVVVHAGSLFDGVDETLRRNADIVSEGHRFVRVADHDPALHRGDVVDASDGVVIPGLIEMHMHGGLSAGEAVGRQWLSYGVTTVRTPSADPYEMAEERESYAAFRRIGPRLFGTGNTVDGSRIYYAGAPALTSSGQVELSLAQAADLGFDLIKTYVRLQDAVQRRVIEDAHAMGLPVTSHELYPGVAYGADGVEHVRGTSRRGFSTKVTQLNRSYQDVVELLVRSGMTITPTVGIYGGFQLVGQEDPTLFDDPRIEVFIGERARRGGGGGGDLATRRRLVSDMASLGRRAVEQGGVVVVGTDSPIIPQGLSLIAEMQALVDYGGMRPVDVMRATTSVSAEAMGYGGELGAVRPGALADLVILGANPLADIRAVRDVRGVIRDGRPYTLEGLLRRPRP